MRWSRDVMVTFPMAKIVVFAKAPVPGQVKTRLAATLGNAAAAQLAEHLLELCLRVVTMEAICPVELWVAGSPSAPCATTHPALRRCAADYHTTLYPQRGADLGERMAMAFEEVLQTSDYAVIVGADVPSLTSTHLRDALSALHAGYDAVVAPTEDGGYGLLGLRRLQRRVFDGVAWGGDTVMHTTRQRFGELGWRWAELPQVWDVDRVADVHRLIRVADALPLSSNARAVLRTLAMHPALRGAGDGECAV